MGRRWLGMASQLSAPLWKILQRSCLRFSSLEASSIGACKALAAQTIVEVSFCVSGAPSRALKHQFPSSTSCFIFTSRLALDCSLVLFTRTLVCIRTLFTRTYRHASCNVSFLAIQSTVQNSDRCLRTRVAFVLCGTILRKPCPCSTLRGNAVYRSHIYTNRSLIQLLAIPQAESTVICRLYTMKGSRPVNSGIGLKSGDLPDLIS